MLSTMFNPSNENSNVKKLMRHILQKMNYVMYNKFLQNVNQHADRDHKFVVIEYIESPSSVLVSRSERLPDTRMSIHNIIQNSDFNEAMAHMFGKSDRVSWYTRRVLDNKDQPTDTRQLVVLNRQEQAQAQEDDDDMPSLIPIVNNSRPILNPEDYAAPALSTSYNYITGLNQTMWSPINFNHVATTSNMIR